VSYFRSEDRNFAIGVISNKTYNVKTVSTCFPDRNWPVDYESLSKLQNVSLILDGIQLGGMNRGKYELQYYLINKTSIPVASSSERGPDLKIDFTIPATDSGYIVLFTANKKNHDWKQKRKLTKEEIKLKRMK
jgi:hypothetical protein